MAILPIIEAPNPFLRTLSKPLDKVTDETRALIANMFETMYAAPGIGLAAIQVGHPIRLLVIDLQEDVAENGEGEGDAPPARIKKPQVFINPEIILASEEVGVYNEGCLSVPEQYADVERPARVRVRWLDERGATHEEELGGLLATCLQHEMDHLEGILFIDHLSRMKRDMLLKKLSKLRKAA
ncbi:MAG: peptide deformylase [Alphaproteobacteria bacterium]|nr:peptide deformylase [Alphaproteobacteria bacterium]MDE2339701.1 peptide deformylase [Alphaproteobacteria bacterium]